jgi:hypothetical protein
MHCHRRHHDMTSNKSHWAGPRTRRDQNSRVPRYRSKPEIGAKPLHYVAPSQELLVVLSGANVISWPSIP